MTDGSVPPWSESLSSRVRRGAAWSVVTTAVTLPVALVTTIVLARVLGPAGFGLVALYTFVLGLTVGLSDLGIGEALLQRGATATGQQDTRTLTSTVRAANTFALLRLPVVAVVAWAVLPSGQALGLYLAAAALLLGAGGPNTFLIATSDLALASRVKLLGVLLSSTAVVLTAITSRDPALAFAAGALGSALGLPLLVLGVPRELRRRVIAPGPLRLTKDDVSFGFGNFVNGQLSEFVFGRSELLFFPASAAAQRGTFAAAQTLAARSTLLLDAVFGALPSAMANAAGRGAGALDLAYARVSRGMRALLAAGGPSLVVLVVVLGPLAFGSGYEGVAVLALVLTGVSLLQTGALPLNLLWYATRKVRPMLQSGAAAGVADLVLSVALVPRHGAAGAVVASALSGVLYLVVVTSLVLSRPRWRAATFSHVSGVVAVVAASVSCGAVAAALPVAVGGRLALGLLLALLVSAALLSCPPLRPDPDDEAALRAAVSRLVLRRADDI